MTRHSSLLSITPQELVFLVTVQEGRVKHLGQDHPVLQELATPPESPLRYIQRRLGAARGGAQQPRNVSLSLLFDATRTRQGLRTGQDSAGRGRGRSLPVHREVCEGWTFNGQGGQPFETEASAAVAGTETRCAERRGKTVDQTGSTVFLKVNCHGLSRLCS